MKEVLTSLFGMSVETANPNLNLTNDISGPRRTEPEWGSWRLAMQDLNLRDR